MTFTVRTILHGQFIRAIRRRRCRKQAGEKGNLHRMLLQRRHVGYRAVGGE